MDAHNDDRVGPTDGFHYAQPLQPGEGFRFGVGSASGLSSSIYRIWTSKNKPDVYIANVHMSDTMKVSLHGSGDWQHSFLSEVAMTYFDRNSERHVDKWQRPDPFFNTWTHAYRITIPRTELRRKQVSGEVRWADDPGHGYWVNIDIMLVGAADDSALDVGEATVIGKLQSVTNEGVVVLAYRYKPSSDQAKLLASYRDALLRESKLSSLSDTSEFPTAGLHGSQGNVRKSTELALTLPPRDALVICTEPTSKHLGITVNWRTPKYRD